MRSHRISKRVLVAGLGHTNDWDSPSIGGDSYLFREWLDRGRLWLLGLRPQYPSCLNHHRSEYKLLRSSIIETTYRSTLLSHDLKLRTTPRSQVYRRLVHVQFAASITLATIERQGYHGPSQEH
ncbi:hypothetical protein AVEN_158892-1 [Araneus ventricosus]|uniref:Uncharacterized protein n=1 Tax=Araneus ventricosus TaxID=182803 RepID=A0A4Y2BAG2_ARAVE|nr:hypothetical protein AVEN_158892-1 [Araneus ventricosus]